MMQQLALDIRLHTGPTLQGFLAGPNAAALEHLRLWTSSERPAPVPTYLWGGAGSGKSHLLRAVQHALHESGRSVGWLDAETLQTQEFQPGWSAVLMDDVHLYTAAQQQNAFNWFVNATTPADGEPLWVLASGALPPADLRLRDDLRSRLAWGQVFQLQVLDEGQRRTVLQDEARRRGLQLGDEVVDFMLHRFSRDLASLMQLLDELDRYALQTQRPLTIPLVKAMLDHL